MAPKVSRSSAAPPGTGARARRRAVALGVVLGAALLYWFAGRVELGAVGAALGDVRPAGIALALACQLAVQPARGLRWRALLARRVHVSRRTAIAVTWIGWTVHAYVPLRIGELARPLVLKRRQQVDVAFALGTQLLERALDLGAVLALVAVALRWGPRARSADAGAIRGALEVAESVVAPLAVVGVLVVVLAVVAAPRLRRFEARLAAGRAGGEQRSRLIGLGRSLAGGATTLRSPLPIARAVFDTGAIWALAILGHVGLFRAFALEASWTGIAPLLVLIVASSLVPTPAGVGSYHAAVQVTLGTLLGVPLATATAYALVAHAVSVVPNTVIGVALAVREGITTAALALDPEVGESGGPAAPKTDV
jgi:uncharacterized membrane protein YbhN (UPF0104 family)